jgi:hypothetical protein
VGRKNGGARGGCALNNGGPEVHGSSFSRSNRLIVS